MTPFLDEGLLERVRAEVGREYEVVSELGRGGMAIVYKAIELELLRPVALKILPPQLASSALAERFKREARTAAAFDHPNIIPIYRVGQAGGLFYIAMKFVEGKPLDKIIDEQGALPIPVVMHVLRAAVRALAFAHANNVVHRDVKAANILVDQDARVVVSDFGIARASEDGGLTATGSLMGTPYYMSPEQCAGHRVGQQSDQYSLGILVFQMLAGSVPFHAETLPGVMQHHFFTPVPDLSSLRADVPPALLEVVRRALEKRPSDRYATTREMQEAVESIPFREADRRRGEGLLRDLVLGVSVPKVDTGVLPPLASTMLMTPPVVSKARQEVAERRGRRGILAAAAASVLAIGALGFAFSRPGTTPVSLAIATPADATPRSDSVPVRAASLAPVVPVPAARVPDSTPRVAPHDSLSRDTATAPVVPRAQRTPAPSSVTSPPAKPAPVRLAETGKMRLRIQPADAEIILDGRFLARGVVLDSVITAGSHRLQVVAPGYLPLDTTLVVRSGETAQLGTRRLVPVERLP